MVKKNVSQIRIFWYSFLESIAIDFRDSIDTDDAYYDGDQQEPVRVDLFQTIDCSIQCPPYWTEPVLQQKQTLVYPTSASVSLKCPYNAKPKAKLTWYKDGQIFLPELYELVKEFEINLNSFLRI
jgi:hypothetical protein